MRHKNILTIVAVFFCVFIIIFAIHFVHDILQQKISNFELEKQKVIKTGIQIIDLRNKYGDLDEYMNKIENNYQLASKSLPERMEQGDFINFLQSTAVDEGIKMIMMMPDDVELIEKGNLKGVNRLKITIKIECSYMQLIKFLKLIESSERMINFSDVSIVSKDNGNLLICEISMFIFSFEQ